MERRTLDGEIRRRGRHFAVLTQVRGLDAILEKEARERRRQPGRSAQIRSDRRCEEKPTGFIVAFRRSSPGAMIWHIWVEAGAG